METPPGNSATPDIIKKVEEEKVCGESATCPLRLAPFMNASRTDDIASALAKMLPPLPLFLAAFDACPQTCCPFRTLWCMRLSCLNSLEHSRVMRRNRGRWRKKKRSASSRRRRRSSCNVASSLPSCSLLLVVHSIPVIPDRCIKAFVQQSSLKTQIEIPADATHPSFLICYASKGRHERTSILHLAIALANPRPPVRHVTT